MPQAYQSLFQNTLLEWSDGKKKEAADLLGIDRRTLYRKLLEYGKADPEEFGPRVVR
ncbi:MAG: hypothetical protein FJ147_27555 [Deltaproteobacteria bacterium]|nr:hypothetical protein [Deltaproteobacteria bacterium]